MDREIRKEKVLHHAVSVVGGFLGGYAIFNHCDLFGNAQTANLIHLVGKIFSADFSGIVFLLLAAASYFAGNTFCVIAEKFIKFDLKCISLIFTSCAVVIIGIFPHVSNHYVALLPILFVTPIQWNAYRTAAGYASSTIFSTNNYRVTVMSLTRYLIDKDKKQADQAKFFGMTLLCFHTGVALSCVTGLFLGTESIWFCFIPITVSSAVYVWYSEGALKRLAHRCMPKKA